MVMWRSWNVHSSSLVNMKLYKHFGKVFFYFKVDIVFPYILATPLLGI